MDRHSGRRIRNRDHLSDRGFFASVMAACALASARVRDGAVTDDRKLPKYGLEQQSEIFYSGAACAILKDFNKAQGLGYLRACGLLAVTAIQYGQIASMHQYLGHFCTLSAMQQFPRRRPMATEYYNDREGGKQALILVDVQSRRNGRSGVQRSSEVPGDQCKCAIPHGGQRRNDNADIVLVRL